MRYKVENKFYIIPPDNWEKYPIENRHKESEYAF